MGEKFNCSSRVAVSWRPLSSVATPTLRSQPQWTTYPNAHGRFEVAQSSDQRQTKSWRFECCIQEHETESRKQSTEIKHIPRTRAEETKVHITGKSQASQNGSTTQWPSSTEHRSTSGEISFAHGVKSENKDLLQMRKHVGTYKKWGNLFLVKVLIMHLVHWKWVWLILPIIVVVAPDSNLRRFPSLGVGGIGATKTSTKHETFATQKDTQKTWQSKPRYAWVCVLLFPAWRAPPSGR